MYVSSFSFTPVVLISVLNQRGDFWVQMCPAVRPQWTTPLSWFFSVSRLATNERNLT